MPKKKHKPNLNPHSPRRYRIRTRPTRSGYLMMLVLFAMLVGSVNYGNNMAFILTFLLISFSLIGLIYTRNNLKGMYLTNLMPQPVFAGERLHIKLELHNQSTGRRFGIWLSPPNVRSVEDYFGPFALSANSNTTAEIAFPTTRRGQFTLSRLGVVTLYPLGLFFARTQVPADKSYLVYPRPEGSRPWPEPEFYDGEDREGFSTKGGDDFTGFRNYRPGEPMHHVDWKAVARGRPMYIKEFTGGGAAKLLFNWEHLGGIGTEARLSQLCKWVLEADEQGTEFGLKLPGKKIDPDSGTNHTLRCLEALAMYETKR